MTSITQPTVVGERHTPTVSQEGVRSGVAIAEPRRHAQRPLRGRLGSKATKEHQAEQARVSADDLRKRLWALHRTMWKITDYDRLKGCHRWLSAGTGAASLRWIEPGQATWGNLQTSSSVWASPLSASAISKTRAEEVSGALKTWFDQDKRHSVEFLTLTLAHDKGQSLREVWDTLAYAWRGITGTASWRGGARYEGDKKRFSIAHWLKSVEATHGKNGWHVHIHCLLFLDRTLSDDERETMENRFYERWRAGAERKGFKAPSRKHGVKIEKALREKSVNDLGSYMAKGALFSVAESLSWEITAGQTAKEARSKDNRSPFQILDSIRKSGDFSRKNSDVKIWAEWEESSLGRRQMAWSKGAKEALGVLDLDDSEAEELAGATSGHEVAQVPFEEWNRTQRDGEKLRDDLVKRGDIAEYVALAKTAKEAHKRAKVVLGAYDVVFEQEAEPVPIERARPIVLPVNHDQAREVLNLVV